MVEAIAPSSRATSKASRSGLTPLVRSMGVAP